MFLQDIKKIYTKNKIIKVSSQNSLQVLIRMFIGFFNIKIIAHFVGPVGMTFIGQLQNFLQIGGTITSLGIKNGIIKYIAKYQNDKNKQQTILYTSVLSVFITTLIFGTIIYIFSDAISIYIFHNDKGLLLKFSIVYFITSNFVNIGIQFLNGLQNTKLYILLNIFNSLTGFFINLTAIYYFNLSGILWSQLFIFSFTFPIACYIIFKPLHKHNKKFSVPILKKLGNYSIMTLVAEIISPVTLIIIRNQIIKYSSVENAGYWEGINKISIQYISLITVSFSFYLLPTLSKLNSNKEIRKEIKQTFKLFIPITIIGGITIYLLRNIIILILFNEKFYPMSNLFIYQTCGDIFKILSWIIAYVFIAREYVKTYIFTEITSALLQIILSRYFLYLNLPINVYYCVENVLCFIIMGILFCFLFKSKSTSIPHQQN